MLLLGVIFLTACQSSNEALSGLPVAQREWLSCSDSDRTAMGNNIYQKGRTEATYRLSGENRVRTVRSPFDRCQGRNLLNEGFCRGNEPKSQLIQCRNSCNQGACSRCGNGAADAGETCSSCPADVRCGPTEACQNGVCVDFCGNSQFDEGETCENCPADAALGMDVESERCDGIDNDCNGQVDDGFDFQNSVRNCGACGNVCPQGQRCRTGACGAFTCTDDDPFWDADGQPHPGGDPYFRGTVTNALDTDFQQDICTEDGRLLQVKCDGLGAAAFVGEHPCPGGCQDGACVR